MSISSNKYKQMSIKEFTKAAKIYDSGKSGIYEMCKYDYPKVLKELKNKKFNDVLDCGCGTGPMIEILCEKYPDKLYTGLDLTPEMIKKAKEMSMYTVLRVFLLDSMAFENIRQQQHMIKPDFIEVLPGVMPKIIAQISHSVKVPIIAGGLITDKEDVMGALSAGAMAVSSTNHKVWNM